LHDQRYAPPAAPVADVAPPPVGAAQLATRTRRFWALLLDTGIFVAAMTILQALLPWDPWAGEANEAWWSPQPVTAALDLALFLLLNAVLLARRGQTLGKALLRIRIVRADGAPATAFQLLVVRYGLFHACAVVPGLGLLAMLADGLPIFGRARRCLHDLAAGTIVVRA
jgi:uncharacterized RDD family membrane protein YckC